MTIVHVMQGLPASGKTTFARTLDAMRFNLDDYRAMMWGDTEWSKEKEHVAVQAMLASAAATIKLGRDIVIDNTHLTPPLPKLYRKAFARLGVTFKVHNFTDMSVDDCITRDLVRGIRGAKVGADVIRLLNENYLEASKNGWRLTDKWMNGEPYMPPEPYEYQLGLPSIIIVDLDGTIAINDGHRGHYEYEKVSDDKPNPNVLALVDTLTEYYRPIFMSGREDRCREETLTWITRHLGLTVGGHTLHMRTTGDHRPDYIIKGELFDAHIRGKYNVLCALDDRDQIVRLWRDIGLTCLQVNYGEF